MQRHPWLAGVVLVLIGSGLLIPQVEAQASVTPATPSIEFREGLVYLSAHDVPLHALLATWEARTGARFIYVDRLPNDAVTIELVGVSERQALGELLKPAVGFVAKSRAEMGVPGPSELAIVYVLAQSDVQDGGAAARTALERAAKDMQAGPLRFATGGEPIVDYRDLPPRDPGDPNGPVGLTPASPGDVEPPPLRSAENDGEGVSGRDPGVNPIPAGLAPPPPPAITSPQPAEKPASPGGTKSPATGPAPKTAADPPKPRPEQGRAPGN
jgi:hypothetical protein